MYESEQSLLSISIYMCISKYRSADTQRALSYENECSKVKGKPEEGDCVRNGTADENLLTFSLGVRASLYPNSFKWMHRGRDKVLNQRMVSYVGIIDGTLLDEAVWPFFLFPFTLDDFPNQ